MRPEGTKCPHANIVHCPLYVAAHEANSPASCIDAQSDGWNGCAVDRGMDYGKAIAALWKAKPGLVKECAERESAEMSRQQRQRNMRAAGIH